MKIYESNLDTHNQQKWGSIKTLIKVEREIIFKGKLNQETAYFVSDYSSEIGAKYFYQGIRSHWQIEAFHYIKDKTFLEDAWKVRTRNAPVNYSIIRNLIINIFRSQGFDCIQATIEKCANNVPFMMGLLLKK